MPRGGIGLATRDDGLYWRWTNDGKAVLEPGQPDARDGGQIMEPEIHFDGRLSRLWYTGYADTPGATGGWKLRIGLAEIGH